MLAAWVTIYSLGAARTLATRRFLATLLLLYLGWIAWDMLAVSLSVFRFPPNGNLPFRLLGVPLEEHLFFLVHILVVWALILLAESARPILDSAKDQP